jgi:hypothetical protein
VHLRLCHNGWHAGRAVGAARCQHY